MPLKRETRARQSALSYLLTGIREQAAASGRRLTGDSQRIREADNGVAKLFLSRWRQQTLVQQQ
jgi:hypothetical protein